jgi:hypothetical protein
MVENIGGEVWSKRRSPGVCKLSSGPLVFLAVMWVEFIFVPAIMQIEV